MDADAAAAQGKDIDYLLSMGEIFTLVAYGQLILENARIYKVETEVLDQIFDFMVRDFARFALQIYGMHGTREEQRVFCQEIMLIRAVPAAEQCRRIWETCVLSLNGEYQMNE